MNYELAKELKDAGFPQTPPRKLWCITCKNWRDTGCLQSDLEMSDRHERESVKVPTLSELIEACRDNLNYIQGSFSLQDESYTTDVETIVAWNASATIAAKNIEVCHNGTQEEAVARLWLALNV